MSNEPEYTVSSGNVFADLGLPNPEEELLKAQIVRTLDHLITEKRLTPQQAAGTLGVEPSDLALLLRGRWNDYSVERLLRCVNALRRNVSIVIDSQDVAPDEEARTQVLAA